MANGYYGLIDLLLCAWCFAAFSSVNRGQSYRAGYRDGAYFGENANSDERELPVIVEAETATLEALAERCEAAGATLRVHSAVEATLAGSSEELGLDEWRGRPR